MRSVHVKQILWPTDVGGEGFIYGWASPLLCVAGVLDVQQKDEAERIVQLLTQSEHGRHIHISCSGSPILLGRCTSCKRRGAGLPGPSFMIELSGLHISSEEVLIIYYRRPKAGSLHYYTLELSNDTDVYGVDKQSKKMPYYAVLSVPGSMREGLNEIAMHQMNYAHSVEKAVTAADTAYSSHTPKALTLLNPDYVLQLVAPYLWPRIGAVSLNVPSILTTPWRFSKWISMTVQQCDTRAEQFSSLPTKFRLLHGHSGIPVEDYCVKYNTFYNFIWLVLNDVIVGTAVGAFICENHTILATELGDFVERHLVESVQKVLIWLDNWPAGLKLNTELSNFYCSTFIGVIGLWGQLLSYVIPHLPALLYAIGAIGSCGMTMIVSCLLDLLNVLTAHLHICYFIGAAMYRQQLRTLGSLWNLFRGKRFNVLRNRIDNWEYDLDQLLLGTILFTLVAFLFPTVLTYYSVFAVLQFCIILLRASLETLLVFMNHFPLFALMLRVKDPWRLSGGIYFEFIPASPSSPSAMMIQYQPVPFLSVFSHFVRIWSRIALHYNPLRLLRCLVTGDYLTPIPGYSIRHRGVPGHDSFKSE